jgi:hypothetical protein
VINAGQFIWKLRMARLDMEKKQRESSLATETVQAASLVGAHVSLTGLSMGEAEELHRNLVQGTQFFGFIAAIAHLLAYIYSPWLK